MKYVIDTEKVPIKIWSNDIEETAIQQAKNLANLPFVFKWICVMADGHQGIGMPIGGILPTKGVLVPSAASVDLGCGVCCVKTNIQIKNINIEIIKQIMGKMRELIPIGFEHNKEKQKWEGFDRAPDIKIIQQELENAKYSLGSMGQNNHFQEIQKDIVGNVYFMIHSGSRNFGYKIAKE